MRVLSYNIRFGGHGRESWIAEVLRGVQPDVVVLQEATDTRVVEQLAQETQMPFWFARRGYSVALLSRLHVAQCYWHRTWTLRHPMLEAKIGDLTVFGVHLQPHFSGWSERRRTEEIRTLVARAAPHRGQPLLLTGDFNAIAPSDVVEVRHMPRWIRFLIRFDGGKIRSNAIQSLADAGYVDGFRALNPDDPGFTFPTLAPHIRFDYAFLTPENMACVREISVVNNSVVTRASDHCPLLTVVEV